MIHCINLNFTKVSFQSLYFIIFFFFSYFGIAVSSVLIYSESIMDNLFEVSNIFTIAIEKYPIIFHNNIIKDSSIENGSIVIN